MGKSKLISTLSFLINAGISNALYYQPDKHEKLKGAKAYWNKDKQLCFEIDGETYRLQLMKD